MKRYQITYTDAGERATCVFRGYDAEHAIERFFDSMEAEGGCQGVEVVSCRKL